MLVVTNKWNLFAPGLLLLSVWLTVRPQREKIFFALLGVVLIAVTDIGSTRLKGLVERPRPCMEVTGTLLGCTDSPSFPSNHAANFFALATFVAAVVPATRWAGFAFATLVAYSRVHVGVHYPLDVLAGAVFGTVIGLIASRVALSLTRVGTAPAANNSTASG
jgi:undecaprenyl-diphosphatase